MWFGESLPSIVEHLHELHHNPVIIDLVHMIERNWKNGGHAVLSLLNANHIDRTIAASQDVYNWLIQRGRHPDTVSMQYLGIDVEQFTPIQDKTNKIQALQKLQSNLIPSLQLHGNTVVIVMIARLADQKRPLFAVECFKALLNKMNNDKSNLDIKFIMAGSGVYYEHVDQRIIEWGLQSNMILLGDVYGDDKLLLLQSADIFFMPSDREGLSYSAAEAMAMSVPFVGTNNGGINELVDTPNGGILIDADDMRDVGSYVDALYTLCVNEQHRIKLGKQARQRVSSLFTASKNMQNIISKHIIQSVDTLSPYIHADGYAHSHVYYANQHAILEDHSLMDLQDTYQLLSPALTRTGQGYTLQ